MKPWLVAAVLKPKEDGEAYQVLLEPKLVMAGDEKAAVWLATRTLFPEEKDAHRLEVFARPF